MLLVLPRPARNLRDGLSVTVSAVVLFLACALLGKSAVLSLPWLGYGVDFALRLDSLSSFIVFSATALAFLVTLYSVSFARGKDYSRQFYAYLFFSLALVNGAVLADNLVLMLFFWEALLLVLFGFIRLGCAEAWRTGIKAFIITGVADLCMMIGIALTAYLSGTLTISRVNLDAQGTMASLAFLLLAAGALAKAGSMPFQSWIPDAATDAPVSFMAMLPASLDKLAGIYFLVRISLDMFRLKSGSTLSLVLMGIGSATLILAVMLALVQKNYKKLLAFHAISQSGYMILGIGTCVPAGIIGGIFHMLNNAVYKCGLFLTAGNVERQAGTTDLEKLGALRSKMPVTSICFAVMALSISGVPPFNGFFSKELIYDAALEQGSVFYIIAIAGSFLTAASFLKLGHAAFLGKAKNDISNVREAPFMMLFPMGLIASACLALGLGNRYVVQHWFRPVVARTEEAVHLPGANITLIIISLCVLIAAVAHHLLRVKATQDALKSADSIHHAPVIRDIYCAAAKKYFDPYEAGMAVTITVSKFFSRIDKMIDQIYNVVVPGVSFAAYRCISAAHAGYYVIYIVWALAGTMAAAWFLLR